MAWIIIAASILLKTFYIFKCTSYANSILFDMSAYWNGALERLAGITHSIAQYALFPPAYIYYLSSFLSIIKPMGLLPHALEITIFINILLSSISGYCVYSITYRLVTKKFLALLALFFYCFSYSTIYLNALILPENLAVPLFVIAVGIITTETLSWKRLILSGFLLGIILSAKPLLAIFILSFVLHIAYTSAKEKKGQKIALFLTFCLLTPIIVTYKNYELSSGKVMGLAAYGGANFYASWAHVKKIECHTAHEGYWWGSFPSTFDDPSAITLVTDQPFYNQSYFFKLGLQAIANDPSVLLKKFFWSDKFFFGDLYPKLSKQPPFYNFLMPLNQWIFFITFLGVLSAFMFFLECPDKRTICFLYSLLGLFFLGIYLVGTFDRRYSSFIESILLIIFFVAIDKIRTSKEIFNKFPG